MSKTTHTKGPWIVVSGQVETPEGIPIARMAREPQNGTTPVERDCNAYLCAAAPEMLAILEAFINHARLNNGDVGRRAIASFAGMAEEAIAKARKND